MILKIIIFSALGLSTNQIQFHSQLIDYKYYYTEDANGICSLDSQCDG